MKKFLSILKVSIIATVALVAIDAHLRNDFGITLPIPTLYVIEVPS